MATRRRGRTAIRPILNTDAAFKAVERVQLGRMTLEVAAADLEVAEARLGPFHPTTKHFRAARDDARLAWDRLRADYGGAVLEAALDEPPAATLEIGGGPSVVLIAIRGRTYRVERLAPTPIAPAIFRLTRLASDDGDGGVTSYHAARLVDGTFQCDCAEWIYHPDDPPPPCKHLAALKALGWPPIPLRSAGR